MELTEVAPQIFACLQPDTGLGASNSGLVGRGGGLVVDTFWDLPHTRRQRALYAGVHPEPPRRVVNTHHNGDHCWGNQLYAEHGAEIIGHRLCAEGMPREIAPGMLQALVDAEPNTLGALEGFGAALRAHFDFTGIELTPPTTVFDADTTLDLDGTRVDLLYVGPAHTAGDVVAHLPDEGVVFTGDVLFHKCTPIGWEGTFAHWIAALDRLDALNPAVVVPGHGPLATVEGLREMRAYLVYVRDAAREHFAAGRSVREACERIELGAYAAWTEPERIAFNVARAYRELRGEPWDAPIDVGSVFSDVAALRETFATG